MKTSFRMQMDFVIRAVSTKNQCYLRVGNAENKLTIANYRDN